MRSVWDDIFRHAFPSEQGYMSSVEAANLAGSSDILTYQWLQPPTAQRPAPFLVMQIKRMAFQNRESEWRRAKRQRRRYLAAIYNAHDPALQGPPPNQIYNGVAIGLRVRFYTFCRDTKRLTIWRPTAPDSRRWNLINNHQQVNACLAHILANH